MLSTLLAKDLRRAWRNPGPWLISLVVPFVVTGLIGAIFGPRSGGGALGRIEIAFVDEDDTSLTEFLRGSLEQMRTNEAGNRAPFELETQFLTRDEAMHLLTEDQLAAAVIIPQGFTDGLLSSDLAVTIELVKNPARAIQPRVVEEVLGLLVTGLNAFKDLAGDQLGDVRALIESDDDFLTRAALVADLLVDARKRLEPVRAYLAPPLIGYEEEKRVDTAVQGPAFNLFAFLMAGMAAMFLLFMADNAMRDLYREGRAHTLERYKTVRDELFAFVFGKVVFAVVISLIGAVILLGGGAVIFQFTWQYPLAVGVLVIAYVFCAAGIMGLLGALMGSEKRADVLNNLFVMGLAVVGGCMFPPEVFPSFLRENFTPLMPTGWFAAAVRALQSGDASNAWMMAAVKLSVLGLATVFGAALLFRRRLEKGVRG